MKFVFLVDKRTVVFKFLASPPHDPALGSDDWDFSLHNVDFVDVSSFLLGYGKWIFEIEQTNVVR